jgi:hypothetical protein
LADYPIMVTVLIDGNDVTRTLFGTDVINPSDQLNAFKNLDISSFIRGPGSHYIEIYTTSGVGQVETRVEIR